MIERQFCHHPFLTFAAGMVCSAILALPAAFFGWHFVILPGLAEEMKVREQIAEGTKLVRLMAEDKGKRRCMDAMMIRGQLVCLEQGGK